METSELYRILLLEVLHAKSLSSLSLLRIEALIPVRNCLYLYAFHTSAVIGIRLELDSRKWPDPYRRDPRAYLDAKQVYSIFECSGSTLSVVHPDSTTKAAAL